MAKLLDGKKLVLCIRPVDCEVWLYLERPEDIVDNITEGDAESEWVLKWIRMTQVEIDALPEFDGW